MIDNSFLYFCLIMSAIWFASYNQENRIHKHIGIFWLFMGVGSVIGQVIAQQ